MSSAVMEKIVSLCRRRGFLFQSSEIYGGLNGFWDYGPLGVELKRNVREAWWRDMVVGHDDLSCLPGAPAPYEMTGLDCSIIMHPQVWKCTGHYDLFHDMMSACCETNKLYRFDHVRGRFAEYRGQRVFVTTDLDGDEGLAYVRERALKHFGVRQKHADEITWGTGTHGGLDSGLGRGANPPTTPAVPHEDLRPLADANGWEQILAPHANKLGTLSPPREFNLMFKTTVGALGGADDVAFLRPETAQGIFVNFKNVLDSTRVRPPFGIAQIGKSFRNEITPRNFTFRSREFEQMEIEFFCHPAQSADWYKYWRERRYAWYLSLGLSAERLRVREHHQEELAHYSVGTADLEYAFPFLADGEFGELEGVAHRADFDLRSHAEGKLVKQGDQLVLETTADGKPKWRGSGKDLSYFDDETRERYIPHVIEPSAGADRATLAFLCEAYYEDEAPDENGKLQSRTVMRLHPRLAPCKAAIFPLVKKDGMPEIAARLYKQLKRKFNVFYDEKGAVGRRYRRQDEAGTPYCITIDGQTLSDSTVTFRDRDSLQQWRVPLESCLSELEGRLQG